MAIEIIMPKLSDTMTDGLLGAWRKSVGERVERGDVIAEVETDKATMDLEAFSSGILLEQRVTAGNVVAVGTIIGLIGTAEEVVTSTIETALPLADMPQTETVVSPAVSSPAARAVEPLERIIPSGTQAAPIVRRRAEELGIDLAKILGSGPGGRIMLDDLQQVPVGAPDIEPVSNIPTEPVATGQSQPLNRIRSAIARTTSSSWQNIPHFYLSCDVEMDQAEELIKTLKNNGADVNLNTLIMSAAAKTLARLPALNTGFDNGGIIHYPHINLAFAVALTDGLQVPVIRDADKKNVGELAAAVAYMADKARRGALTPEDISGGSFTVSNLGMYGIDTIASIIMPGQAAILGLGSVTSRPVVRNGQIEIGRIMTATLSCDHRIIDGATAAGFLHEWKRLLEEPGELTL